MSRLLITGATGFVGRHLVRRAFEQGHDVLAATRGQVAIPHATVRPVGPLESANWEGALRGVDAVIHLAARVHQMQDAATDPLAAFRIVNRDATLRLAEAAQAQGVQRFVFLSSVKAAVDATAYEGVGDAVTPAPRTPYGISKREAELGLLSLDGLQSIILRPPLVYGPGIKGNLLSFYRLANTGLPMPFGRIRNQRSLVGVSNLADAVLHAVSAPVRDNPVYFLEDTRLSTPELYSAVAGSLGRRGPLLQLPVGAMRLAAVLAGKADAVDRLTDSLAVDASRFRATGWTPAVSFADELESLAHNLYP